jgi:hypothetical protein
MSFSELPSELIRKIITQNDESSLLNASVVNKMISSMGLNRLLFPVQLENFVDVGIDDSITLPQRKRMHKHIKDSAIRLFKRRKTGTKKKDNEKIMLSLFYTYDYIETLNQIIGDATKYDSPHSIYRMRKSQFNWKILGFMNYEHFLRTDKSDKNMNVWNSSKTIGIKIASSAGSKSLQAII